MFLENKIVVWWIAIAVTLLLAFFTFNIAKKKGYNMVFFLIYSIFAPGFSLLHVISLPDKSDTTKRMYSSKALVFNALAVVLFAYLFWVYIFLFIMNLKYYINGGMGLFDAGFGIMNILLLLLLVISIILGRRNVFSLTVHIAYFMYYIGEVTVMITRILNDGVKGDLFYDCFMIAGEVMTACVSIASAYIVDKYGIKSQHPSGKKDILFFILPALLCLLSKAIIVCGVNICLSIPGWYPGNIFSLCIMLGMPFIQYLCLGLFYYEDSKAEI